MMNSSGESREQEGFQIQEPCYWVQDKKDIQGKTLGRTERGDSAGPKPIVLQSARIKAPKILKTQRGAGGW